MAIFLFSIWKRFAESAWYVINVIIYIMYSFTRNLTPWFVGQYWETMLSFLTSLPCLTRYHSFSSTFSLPPFSLSHSLTLPICCMDKNYWTGFRIQKNWSLYILEFFTKKTSKEQRCLLFTLMNFDIFKGWIVECVWILDAF